MKETLVKAKESYSPHSASQSRSDCNTQNYHSCSGTIHYDTHNVLVETSIHNVLDCEQNTL